MFRARLPRWDRDGPQRTSLLASGLKPVPSGFHGFPGPPAATHLSASDTNGGLRPLRSRCSFNVYGQGDAEKVQARVDAPFRFRYPQQQQTVKQRALYCSPLLHALCPRCDASAQHSVQCRSACGRVAPCCCPPPTPTRSAGSKTCAGNTLERRWAGTRHKRSRLPWCGSCTCSITPTQQRRFLSRDGLIYPAMPH